MQPVTSLLAELTSPCPPRDLKTTLRWRGECGTSLLRDQPVHCILLTVYCWFIQPSHFTCEGESNLEWLLCTYIADDRGWTRIHISNYQSRILSIPQSLTYSYIHLTFIGCLQCVYSCDYKNELDTDPELKVFTLAYVFDFPEVWGPLGRWLSARAVSPCRLD